MIWRVKNFSGEKVWYSEEIILKIKELCIDAHKKQYAGTSHDAQFRYGKSSLANDILTLLENEAKNG